nr:MAG TPA: hypothetical protein [Caudoviricetes sp.]
MVYFWVQICQAFFCRGFCAIIFAMKGLKITFNKQITVKFDDFNNPITEVVKIAVDDCLIAPVTEPVSAREQQAINQARDQVRVHLPKTFTGDVSASTFVYDGKTFTLDSDSVVFMPENTPTRWNRYLRAECLTGGDLGARP